MNDAAFLIEHFHLQKHPEGGWFSEVYRSGEIIPPQGLPGRYGKERNVATSIYFLLEGHDFSAFHRLLSDETWHFYSGCPLNLHIIHPVGILENIILGNEARSNMQFQYTIPHGCWFAARPADPSSFSFIGCSVAPGFDFEDFELASRDRLIEAFPMHQRLIERLSR